MITHNDDVALVKRLLAKDQKAFQEFFDTYFGRLYRFCHARLSEQRACEDIVQESLCKAVKNLSQYRGEAALLTWLCQICRNEISNWYRKHDNTMALVSDIDDDTTIRTTLETLAQLNAHDASERQAIEKMVQLVLDYLPNNYGKVLELKYLEELSVKEMAERMETSVIAVQSLLARARTAFRQGFDELHNEFSAPKV